MGVRNVDGLFSLEYLAAMQTTVEIFKSLADETRLRLLILLQGGNEHCVCDLMQALDMPQSTVSRHLAYLKRNGWLHDRRGGVWMYYSLTKKLEGFLQAQLVLIINQLGQSSVCRADKQRLETYLRDKDTTACR
jgi:ArsR family transcriptional regulator